MRVGVGRERPQVKNQVAPGDAGCVTLDPDFEGLWVGGWSRGVVDDATQGAAGAVHLLRIVLTILRKTCVGRVRAYRARQRIGRGRAER